MFGLGLRKLLPARYMGRRRPSLHRSDGRGVEIASILDGPCRNAGSASSRFHVYGPCRLGGHTHQPG